MKETNELIRKSIGASVLIGLGNYALLKLGNPIGPVIFALGLLGVCYMGLNLFTGKCGFYFQEKIKWQDLFSILLVNLAGGYVFGYLASFTDAEIIQNAIIKVGTWDYSFAFLLKSILCGIIMYIAVLLYKKGTPLGIIYGIPLFIFCGFQHCIANIITLGVARTFHFSILICIVGNFAGSIMMWYLSKKEEIIEEKPTSKAKLHVENVLVQMAKESNYQNTISSFKAIHYNSKKEKLSYLTITTTVFDIGSQTAKNISFYSLMDGKKCEYVKNCDEKAGQMSFSFKAKYVQEKNKTGIEKTDFFHLLCIYEDKENNTKKMIIGIVVKNEKEGKVLFDYFVREEGTPEFEDAIKVYPNYEQMIDGEETLNDD